MPTPATLNAAVNALLKAAFARSGHAGTARAAIVLRDLRSKYAGPRGGLTDVPEGQRVAFLKDLKELRHRLPLLERSANRARAEKVSP